MPLLPTIKEEEVPTWCQHIWHCRLQLQLMIPAAIVFLAGGLKLGWAVFESPPAEMDYEHNSQHLVMAWFGGGAFGAVIAAIFVGRVTKNVAHLLSAGLLAIGGTAFAAMPHNFTALLLACVSEGTAVGLMQVQAFTSGGELASKDIRGLVMSAERCFLWLGILLQLTFTYFWYADGPMLGRTALPDQIHGTAVACLGLAAAIVTLRQRTESPILLLQQQGAEAMGGGLKRLTDTQLPANEMARKSEDCMHLVSMGTGQGSGCTVLQRRIGALLKVLVLRCFVALALCQPFNRIYLAASWSGFNPDTNCMYTMAATGLVASVLGSLAIDRYGRRRMCVISLLPAAAFILATGGVMAHLASADAPIGHSNLQVIAALMLVFQFLICFGASIAAVAYLCEAFAISVKPKCIACVLVAEYCLQLVLCNDSDTFALHGSAMFFVMGCMSLILGLSAFLVMPETKGATLSECVQKFQSA